jgi:hypothetical protein
MRHEVSRDRISSTLLAILGQPLTVSVGEVIALYRGRMAHVYLYASHLNEPVSFRF